MTILKWNETRAASCEHLQPEPYQRRDQDPQQVDNNYEHQPHWIYSILKRPFQWFESDPRPTAQDQRVRCGLRDPVHGVFHDIHGIHRKESCPEVAKTQTSCEIEWFNVIGTDRTCITIMCVPPSGLGQIYYMHTYIPLHPTITKSLYWLPWSLLVAE